MARSQQTFNKKEKEKKRLKKREEKAKKKEARKAEKGGGIPFAYVDQYGNLTDTPPDTTQPKVEVDAETINLDYSKQEVEVDPVRKGKVAFFDSSKGFGFIMDTETQEKYFTHVSGLLDEIKENDKVTFELEKGAKGMNAVRVKKA